MIAEDFLKKHRHELGQKISSNYKILECIDQLELPEELKKELDSEASIIIETLIRYSVHLGDQLCETAGLVLETCAANPLDAFSGWRKTIEACVPSRRALTTVTSSMGRWLSDLHPLARMRFLEHIPNLANIFFDRNSGVYQAILQALNHLDDDANAEHFLEALTTYNVGSSEVHLGVCHICSLAIKSNQQDFMSRLIKVLPAERIYDNREQRKFIPALASLGERCHSCGDKAWVLAMNIILTIAESNLSSAYATSCKLKGLLGKLSQSEVIPYLKDFLRLVQSIGVRAIGFCLKQLAIQYQRPSGVKASQRAVEMAALIAERQGATAAMSFLAGETKAAKALLSDIHRE